MNLDSLIAEEIFSTKEQQKQSHIDVKKATNMRVQ